MKTASGRVTLRGGCAVTVTASSRCMRARGPRPGRDRAFAAACLAHSDHGMCVSSAQLVPACLWSHPDHGVTGSRPFSPQFTFGQVLMLFDVISLSSDLRPARRGVITSKVAPMSSVSGPGRNSTPVSPRPWVPGCCP